jgi:hypothetical protein
MRGAYGSSRERLWGKFRWATGQAAIENESGIPDGGRFGRCAAARYASVGKREGLIHRRNVEDDVYLDG